MCAWLIFFLVDFSCSSLLLVVRFLLRIQEVFLVLMLGGPVVFGGPFEWLEIAEAQ